MPLSYSQLSSYKSCPRKYEYAFVKNIKQPLTPEGCFGVSMHSCLAKFGKREMALSLERQAVSNGQSSLFADEAPKHAPSPQLSAHSLIQFWHESFVTSGYKTTVEADFDRKRGEFLVQQFFEWWGKELRTVLAIEKGFKIKVDSASSAPAGSAQHDTTITGRFDRVEEHADGTVHVIDFKTGGMRSQDSVDQDLQLSMYALAAKELFGKEVSALTMLFLSDEELVEITSTRSEGELRTATKSIQLLSERIASKNYRPTPSALVCRSCPYRRVCDVSAV